MIERPSNVVFFSLLIIAFLTPFFYSVCVSFVFGLTVLSKVSVIGDVTFRLVVGLSLLMLFEVLEASL